MVCCPADIHQFQERHNLFLLVNGMAGLFVENNTKQFGNIISLRSRKQNKASAYLLNTHVLLHKNNFEMTARMSTCDGMIGFHSSLLKIKHRCPGTQIHECGEGSQSRIPHIYPGPLPPGLNIDRHIQMQQVLEVSNFLTFMYSMSNIYVIISFMQMEVEEEKQHEGIQQYYITKIEALQVTCGNWTV